MNTESAIGACSLPLARASPLSLRKHRSIYGTRRACSLPLAAPLHNPPVAPLHGPPVAALHNPPVAPLRRPPVAPLRRPPVAPLHRPPLRRCERARASKPAFAPKTQVHLWDEAGLLTAARSAPTPSARCGATPSACCGAAPSSVGALRRPP